MTQASHASDAPFASRYTTSQPPRKLASILNACVRAARRPEYRSHSGFHDNNAIRAVICAASNANAADADEIQRFLKKEKVLVERGEVWAYDAEAAARLCAACGLRAADPARIRSEFESEEQSLDRIARRRGRKRYCG